MKHPTSQFLASFIVGLCLLSSTTSVFAADDSHATLAGSMTDCTVSQKALKADFEQRITDFKAVINQQDTENTTETYRAKLHSDGKWTDKQEKLVNEEKTKYENLGNATLEEINATFNFIDQFCTTDAAFALQLQTNYYQTHLSFQEKLLDLHLWMRKNLRVYNSTLPADEQETAKEIMTSMMGERKIILVFKKLLKSTKKETTQTIFSSPTLYPISAY